MYDDAGLANPKFILKRRYNSATPYYMTSLRTALFRTLPLSYKMTQCILQIFIPYSLWKTNTIWNWTCCITRSDLLCSGIQL